MLFWRRDEKANYYHFRMEEEMELNDQLTEKITELETKIKSLEFQRQVLIDSFIEPKNTQGEER